MVKNYTEVLVDDVFKEVRENLTSCVTGDCIADIKSIALNNLDQQYFLSRDEEGDKKSFILDKQRRITTLAKLAEAVHSLCDNCPHKVE